MLTEDATKTVMQSHVMSRLDYCNALLIGIQQDLIAKLQRLQNSAARIVSRTRKLEHITPVSHQASLATNQYVGDQHNAGLPHTTFKVRI